MATVLEKRSRVKILNLNLDRDDVDQVVDRLERFVEEGRPHQVATINLQFLSLARADPEFARIVNGCDLVVVDGMPLIWMSRLKREPIGSRVTGHDLLERCAALAQRRGHSIFLLGGRPRAAEDAVQRLRAAYPGLRVTSTEGGRVSEAGEAEEPEELKRLIRDSKPTFLFVAFACPKQELWIRRNLDELGVPVCVGIGGTLDIFTGRLSRAPAWMQRWSLEWVYRLRQEPRRLWRRYILGDLPTTLVAAGETLLVRVVSDLAAVRRRY